MANEISLVTWSGSTVTPLDDALIYEKFSANSGIIEGCEVTIKDASTLHIAAGHGIVCGRKFTVASSDVPVALSGGDTLLGRVYIHLDLSSASDPIQLMTETGATLTDETQETDANINAGVWDMNVATYTVSTTTIADLVNVAPSMENSTRAIGQIESTNFAVNNYAVSKCFVHNGRLCKATATITAGDALVEGTNFSYTNVVDEFGSGASVGGGALFIFSDPDGDHTNEEITITNGDTTVTSTVTGTETTVSYPATGTITVTVGTDYTRIITLPYFKDVHFNLGVSNYGFRVSKATQNPTSRVTYLGDCVGFTPAKMNFSQDAFDYGDWAGAFFMPRPCILKNDGTVDYYLDPNDYTKKADGTVADISSTSIDGDVMLEFPKIWVKRTEDANYYYTYISDQQIDSDYKCYANLDPNGQEIDHFYVAAYDGYIYNNVLRSLSGKTPANTVTGSDFITRALAKNSSSNYENGGWYISQWCDRALICDLLILIGKSTNTQETFGFGHYEGGTSASSLKSTGTMNDKGLFWGKSTSGYGVKVFGIENFWGNMWKFCAGLMASGASVYAKMTWTNADGSPGRGYGTTAVSTSKSLGKTLGGTSGGYINNTYNSEYGNVPITANGSSDTYECDGLWFNATANVYFARVGGSCSDGLTVGAFAVHLYGAVSYSGWSTGASLSCKPLAV